jgi:hypothetical protein
MDPPGQEGRGQGGSIRTRPSTASASMNVSGRKFQAMAASLCGLRISSTACENGSKSMCSSVIWRRLRPPFPAHGGRADINRMLLSNAAISTVSGISSCRRVMFGPRNPAFVVDRVFFVDGDTPCRLMYPSPRHIEVELSNNARHDRDKMLLQLAHETVHTLWPVGVDDTHVIEEGAATHFSLTVPKFTDPTYSQRTKEGLTEVYRPYLDAEIDVAQLLSCDPLAIFNSRENRSFCDITAEDILRVAPTCPHDVARRLTRKFSL